MQQGKICSRIITIQNRDFLPIFLQEERKEHSNCVQFYVYKEWLIILKKIVHGCLDIIDNS